MIVHQYRKDYTMNKINLEVSDLTYTSLKTYYLSLSTLTLARPVPLNSSIIWKKKFHFFVLYFLCTDKEKFMPQSDVLKRH